MNPAPGFAVGISVATQELLARLRRQAAADGRDPAFMSALRAVLERLRADPVSYGEELFDLKVMRLTIKVAVAYPRAVEFGVYLERRQVLVRTFRYLTPAD